MAGDDERRRSELLDALEDETCRAVVAARGGYGATRLLPSTSLAALRRSPRWLVGFSDFSAVHWAAQSVGVASLHAANVTTLGAREELRAPWAATLEADRLVQHFDCLEVAVRGSAAGRLVGGNLTVLAAMAGGPTPTVRVPLVLVLEDVAEAPYRLDRALAQLWASGVLDDVVGCVLGDFTECTDRTYGTAATDVVVRFLSCLRVPVLVGMPTGHGPRNVPLVLGHWATLDGSSGTLSVGPSAS